MDTRREKFTHADYRDYLEVIERESAKGAPLPRVIAALHAHLTAGLLHPGKAAGMHPVERYGHQTVLQPHMGQWLRVRTDFCVTLHDVLVRHVISGHVSEAVDTVFEIGCGAGIDLVGLAGLWPEVRFYGGEIASFGKTCLERLAAIGGLANVRAVNFDSEAADFGFLRDKNVLVYSNFALVYANPFPRDFFPRLLDTVKSAHVLLFEPVSFELAADMSESPLYPRERARALNLCEDLCAVVKELAATGRITVEEVIPDISGRSGINAVSLLRFKKAA